MEDNTEIQLLRQRSSNIDPEAAPPPTPRMRASMPAILLALQENEDLDGIPSNAHIVPESEHANQQGCLPDERGCDSRHRGRERRRQTPSSSASQSASSSSTSTLDKQRTELIPDSRRRSRSQDYKKIFTRTASDREISKAREHAKRAQEEDGGVLLKPLTPLQPASMPPSRKPTIARRRSASIAKLNSEQLNQICREEAESMTENSVIRGYARTSQEELYGTYGMSDIMNAPLMQRYPEPSRDTDEINRSIYNMTVHNHDYRVGGPPGPVDIYNIDWDTDVSEVQGRAEFEHAREAKAFAAYAMFTDREEEIDTMRRMQAHGYLKEGTEIKYGYQAMGPRGSIAWLTYEGQEIGGRLREEYERGKAVTGELLAFFRWRRRWESDGSVEVDPLNGADVRHGPCTLARACPTRALLHLQSTLTFTC